MSKSSSRTAEITKTPTTPADAARVQSAVAKANKGQVPKGSHVGRMQKAATRNTGKPGDK